MNKAQDIAFGNGERCTLELDSAAARPSSDPELTVSTYPVRGLNRGELSILVTRTQAPAIVRVDVLDLATQLTRDELEQIRYRAEAILRSESQ
jgi:hypothetical protein